MVEFNMKMDLIINTRFKKNLLKILFLKSVDFLESISAFIKNLHYFKNKIFIQLINFH